MYGKIAEHWSQFDLAGLLQQLGAMPASAEGAGKRGAKTKSTANQRG